jgi:drug/metabolite transporter (DMT)-like permease
VQVTRRSVALAAAGAMCIASSATLVRLAAVAPATVAYFRCLYALPFLAALAAGERRRLGPRPWRERRWALGSGVFFALDLVLWHHAIDTVGAGIATVLGNLQVVVVAFAAWWLLGERPGRRLAVAVPAVLAGVVLISGVVGSGAYGSHPAAGVAYGVGTSVAYAGFLLMLRHGSDAGGGPARPLLDATAVTTVVAAALGPVAGGIDLVPRWPSAGWLLLLAVTSQVVGWLLISLSLPRLPAALTSLLLLLQPLASVVLAALTLGERPSPLQLTGCAIVLAGVVYGATAPRRPVEPLADVAPEDAAAAPTGVGAGFPPRPER